MLACSADADVLVAKKIHRSVKFLCALGSGKFIVDEYWMNELKEKRHFVGNFKI